MSTSLMVRFIYKLINNGVKIWVQENNLNIFIPDKISFSSEENIYIKLNKNALVKCLQHHQIYSRGYETLILK